MSSAPIADLSYRNYDGELTSTNHRWWVIAKSTMMMAMKKRAIWWYAIFSGFYYVAMIIFLFIIDQITASVAPGQRNPVASVLTSINWKDQFLTAFSLGQIWFLAISLVIGAGAIANDNRANALLVYLSKPCDKRDYIFGKWIGVFIPLFVVSATPSLVFYFYGAMSYRDLGFISSDPWLILKLPIMLAIGSAFHASIVIGFSSMFNQGRMAGAVYAGVYFLSNFFTKLMSFAWLASTGGRRGHGNASEETLNIISKLFYTSVDGLNIGMSKGILGTNGSPPFGIRTGLKEVPAPSLFFSLGLIVVISAVMMYIAWRRIRPVEIVG